jgi:hypothetical protein
MSRHITQRELRNESGRVFVPKEAALAAFASAPLVAPGRFRKDVDALIDQDPTPRG